MPRRFDLHREWVLLRGCRSRPTRLRPAVLVPNISILGGAGWSDFRVLDLPFAGLHLGTSIFGSGATFMGNSVPTPGQIARVRQRAYLVENVVPSPSSGGSPLVKLSCVDDDAQGQPLEVLWNSEIDAEPVDGDKWDAIARRGFDDPKLFGAYLNTLRWNCVTATDPRLFQAPFRAGIRIDAYQLEPLRKALLLPRVNLFIADDVGLGKTIEAGLIARELLLRKKVREIVVCCPPSMLLQWKDELEARFGLTFEILDKDYVTRVRRERGFGVNPWDTHTRFLISQRLLIDEAYATPFRNWLGSFRSGSLLILDEAHHAAPSSGQKYAIDSQITRVVREVARCFEHRLFLSATPHNGHSNSFSALLEILDPQRFFRGMTVPPATWKRLLGDVMVRRLKDDLREVVGGFPKRRVVAIDIDGLPADAPELRLSALLDEYRQLREKRLHADTKRNQAAAGLLITGLQQRLLSSVEAFSRTLRVHRKTVLRHWEEAQTRAEPTPLQTSQLDLVSATVDPDDDRATLNEGELQAEEDVQIEAATAATASRRGDAGGEALFHQEQKLLDEMTAIAESARGEPDARVRKLIAWMRTNMCAGIAGPGEKRVSGAPWTAVRIIIFTEWDDTKRYLSQQLAAAIEGTDRADDRIAIYHGPTPVDERERIKRAFNADPSKHPVRVLIATDAAREGLNLQAHCWNLFHFDVPWNPSRMEQRNGRVDRKLQPNTEVFCHYFFYKQRPEDRIIAALVRKTDTIKRELGSLGQVIDAKLHTTMSRGIQRNRVEAIEREIDDADLDANARQAVTAELEASRDRQNDLREQIDRLRTRLDESKRDIGFDQDHFRAALSCSLEIMNAPPLSLVGGRDSKQWRFPSLDQREGADARWADTMDTLRAPRQKDQKPWEWRNTSPIRPVVFEDPGIVTDEVVHLHLEHRVVQRLLGRFMAQGFVYDDLARACLAQSSDAVPRVMLLGRLCLYGSGAARLHEELIPIAARWIDPKVRKDKLAPYARDAETRTLDLLDEALRKPTSNMSDVVLKQLQASAAHDVTELLPHLQVRGEEFAAIAERKLRDRGEAEAKAMRSILEDQQKHIASTVAKHAKDDPSQLRLRFSDDEVRQLDANKKYWAKRLAMIDQELTSEPTRIKDVYEIKAKRIEPVGLIYLWPVTG